MKAARCQRGQATTEFVVLALALVPMLLIVPLLGKYIDLMQTTEVASRYVAFEGAVHHSGSGWKSDAVLAEEVRRRFFSNSDAGIKTGDVAGNFNAHRNALWRDHAGNPLVNDFGGQVAVSTERRGFNFYGPTRAVWRDGFGLPEDNLHVGTVTVSPLNVVGLAPFDAINLRIARHTGVLVDSWAARSVADVRSRVERSPAIYPASAIEEMVTRAGELPRLLTDPLLVPGLRDWEVVPSDRLGGGR
ncbi:MAG: hypothetical protein AB1430_03280 [Pseudomonadota bacterium]